MNLDLIRPLGDQLSLVQVVDHHDNDMTVVNAARQSMAKQKPGDVIDDRDIHLLRYLAQHKHWAPAAHVHLYRHVAMTAAELVWWQDLTHKFAFTRLIYSDDTLDGYYHVHEAGSLYSWIQAGIDPEDVSLCHIVESYKIAGHQLRASKPNLLTASHLAPTRTMIPYMWGVGLTAYEIAKLVPMTLRLTMPIFVDRQWATHKQDLTHGDPELARSEESRRYVTHAPSFFVPDKLRLKAEHVKQGSSDETVDTLTFSGYPTTVENMFTNTVGLLEQFYEELLEQQVAPELARMILPLSTYVTFWETGTIAAWRRLYDLRVDAHAQREIQAYALAVGKLINQQHPDLWEEYL